MPPTESCLVHLCLDLGVGNRPSKSNLGRFVCNILQFRMELLALNSEGVLLFLGHLEEASKPIELVKLRPIRYHSPKGIVG